MENFYSRITERKKYLDISEKEKKEYEDEYVSETNINLIDSIIDYHFIVKLPDFISKSIKKSRKSSDLDKLDFEIEYIEEKTTFPEYSSFGPMKMYCEEFTYPFDNSARKQTKYTYDTGCEGLFVDRRLYDKLYDETFKRAMIYNGFDRHEDKPGIVVTPLHYVGRTGVNIHGTAKELATIYYLELESYGQRNSYKKDNKVCLADYDEKDLTKKAHQLRVKRSPSDEF